MKKNSVFLLLSILSLCACSSNNAGGSNEEPKPREVSVFLMGGQSNMEG